MQQLTGAPPSTDSPSTHRIVPRSAAFLHTHTQHRPSSTYPHTPSFPLTKPLNQTLILLETQLLIPTSQTLLPMNQQQPSPPPTYAKAGPAAIFNHCRSLVPMDGEWCSYRLLLPAQPSPQTDFSSSASAWTCVGTRRNEAASINS